MRNSTFWCVLIWAPDVLAQEIVQVQTPASTMHELARRLRRLFCDGIG